MSLSREFQIIPLEANNWWQKNDPTGTILNRLMLVFIFLPIGLVWKQYYALSFVVFACMIPYGFLVRKLAVRAVKNHLTTNPGEVEVFQQQGIISC